MEVPRRVGALCGVAGPAAFVTGWVVNGLRTAGYDPTSDAISRLAAEGAPTRPAMTACFVAFGVLVPVWADTLARELAVPALRPVVTVAGVATLAVAALPLTQAGGTGQDALHAVAAGTGYVAMALTPLVAARALRGPARAWSLATGGLAAGCLLATLLGPSSGGFQRAGLTAVDLWHVVVAGHVLGRSVRGRSVRGRSVRGAGP